jgi:hypothetical protein
MDKNLLKSFWVLAESNEHTRVNCTLELIANIKEKQGDVCLNHLLSPIIAI